MDLKGSFIPGEDTRCEQRILAILREKITGVFAWKSVCTGNNNSEVPNLRIILGDNRLDTCFQYQVKDPCGNKLMNIKIYDKSLDLCSREGISMIGSRINKALGAK